MIQGKRTANRLGIRGWALGGRWGMERYAYTLHRITGLGILSYFLLHVFVTSSRFFGENVWRAVMGFVDKPIFKIGELLVYIAFCFHGMNGLRLILIELGFVVGRPEEPIYPYRSSLHKQRPLLIIAMLIAGVFIIFGGYNFLLMLSH